MSADTATDGHERDDGVACDPAAGQRVFRPWMSSTVSQSSGRWEVYVGVKQGTVEMIGDRPLVRHGPVYEDMDGWHATAEAARASEAGRLRVIAADIISQATRYEEEAQRCQECK